MRVVISVAQFGVTLGTHIQSCSRLAHFQLGFSSVGFIQVDPSQKKDITRSRAHSNVYRDITAMSSALSSDNRDHIEGNLIDNNGDLERIFEFKHATTHFQVGLRLLVCLDVI